MEGGGFNSGEESLTHKELDELMKGMGVEEIEEEKQVEDDDTAEKKEAERNKSGRKEGGKGENKTTGGTLFRQTEMELSKEKGTGNKGAREEIERVGNEDKKIKEKRSTLEKNLIRATSLNLRRDQNKTKIMA